MARRLLWASLGLAPLTIVIDLTVHPGKMTIFILAAVSLIPLAWLIGEATEHAAQHTGPGIGGFLNATFGNAPELIIAMFAVADGLFEVVRGSLTGSVVGNLLLVLGFSLLVGPAQRIDRESAMISIGLVVLATAAFLIVAVPAWEGDTNRHSLQILSLPVSIALLVVYVVVTWVQLRRHRATFVSEEIEEETWSLPASLGVLAIATAVTAFVAELLVHSIQDFAEKVHVSDFFVAAVIVAIVGNAAEHGGAVVVARRGHVKLATEIALSSSAQVAVFLIPAVALLSWAVKPLTLAFRQVEIGVLGVAAILTALLLVHGRSSSWRGAALIVAYAGAAVVFYKAGGR
ncbi:MAG TPA: calcium/proton exchanger [Gaiellaceae bacterium]|nr:calcium/proton exchanger [Gaiellaceae bacterium]